MKVTQSLINSLTVCGIALALVSTSAAQTKEYVAKVVRVKGNAQFSTGGSLQPLKVGTVLRAGSRIQTGSEAGSFVDVILGDADESLVVPRPPRAVPGPSLASQAVVGQNTVHLYENTEVSFEKLVATETGRDVVTETQLELKKGRITGNVKKMPAAAKYEVKLPKGVAGIRGTVYDITDDGVIRVAEGAVVLSFLENGVLRTVTVTAGFSFDINNPGAGLATLSSGVIGQIISDAHGAGGWTPPTPPPGVIVEPSVSTTEGQ